MVVFAAILELRVLLVVLSLLQMMIYFQKLICSLPSKFASRTKILYQCVGQWEGVRQYLTLWRGSGEKIQDLVHPGNPELERVTTPAAQKDIV